MNTQRNDKKTSHTSTLEKEWVTEFSRLLQVVWLSSSLIRQCGKNKGPWQHSRCIESLCPVLSKGFRSSFGDITSVSKYTVSHYL